LHGSNEPKLAPRHRFQLALELVGVAPKGLNNFGIFDAVEEFDGFPVILHAGNSSVVSLGAKRGPNLGAKCEFRRGALETDAIKGVFSNSPLNPGSDWEIKKGRALKLRRPSGVPTWW